jgi:hypothetical protein
MPELHRYIDMEAHAINTLGYRNACKAELDTSGVLKLDGFVRPETLQHLIAEADDAHDGAFYTVAKHNVYLTKPNDDLPQDHIFNQQLSTSKGCICTDQVPEKSPLKAIYNSAEFQSFIAAVVGEDALYPYDDPLSSVNVHYANDGQELNWHFDNSEFAITLLLQSPKAGGVFEYVKNLRDADAGDMNYDGVSAVLEGRAPVEKLDINPGALVLFRGRNSMHRVTPTIGDTQRILVVLAYNSEPNIALSETARKTFYGRLG